MPDPDGPKPPMEAIGMADLNAAIRSEVRRSIASSASGAISRVSDLTRQKEWQLLPRRIQAERQRG